MNSTLFTSVGFLHYEENKAIVEVDQGIVDFYRFLIPKYYYAKPQKYKAHISVVRKETPPNMQCWGKYEGEQIEFHYSNIIHYDNVYFWLNAFCKRLEEIRLELGLPVSSPYTLPPAGFDKCFHISVANCKNNK